MEDDTRYALIVVDVQNDFVEGGSLAIRGGRDLAGRIREFLSFSHYDLCVASKDWHIDPEDHFEKWPVHCVADTPGAELVEPLNETQFDFIIHKGMFSDGYSAFENSSLDDILRGSEITHVDVVGIAGDFCVKATAIDAAKLDYEVAVMEYLTVNVNEFPREELEEYGITVFGLETKKLKEAAETFSKQSFWTWIAYTVASGFTATALIVSIILGTPFWVWALALVAHNMVIQFARDHYNGWRFHKELKQKLENDRIV